MEDKHFIIRDYLAGVDPLVSNRPFGHQYRRNVKRGETSRNLNKFNKNKVSI